MMTCLAPKPADALCYCVIFPVSLYEEKVFTIAFDIPTVCKISRDIQ